MWDPKLKATQDNKVRRCLKIRKHRWDVAHSRVLCLTSGSVFNLCTRQAVRLCVCDVGGKGQEDTLASISPTGW